MQLEFQKKIASGQFTLHFVSILSLILWISLPMAEHQDSAAGEFGLWRFVSAYFSGNTIRQCLAMGLSALTVYLIAELTNTNVLLRISSRMLSSLYAYFLGIIMCLHILEPGHVVVIFSLLSFFTLFATYQSPSPVLTFLTYLSLSVGSLFFPKILWLIPTYWISQGDMRSWSARCLLASVFGAILPYWLFFAIASCYEGGVELFVATCSQMVDFKMPDYSSFRLVDVLLMTYLFIFFAVGFINFRLSSYLDKTRVRILYNIISAHALVMFLFLLLMPHCFHNILPLCLVDVAIVGGHYVSLTYNKFSHIYCLVMLALSIALVVAQIIL